MGFKSAYPKWLAIVGTVLVGLPILAPFILGMGRVAGGAPILIDYLMPAELFPVVLVGMILLLWAAIATKTLRRPIAITIGVALAGLFGSQALAVVTGLASGAIEPTGWEWVAVLVILGIYDLCLVVLAVLGILLVRKLGRKVPPT